MNDDKQILQACRSNGFDMLRDIPEFTNSIILTKAFLAWSNEVRKRGEADQRYLSWEDQTWRALVSVPANLAEARFRIRPNQLIQYTLVARASIAESLALFCVWPDVPTNLVNLARAILSDIDTSLSAICEQRLAA